MSAIKQFYVVYKEDIPLENQLRHIERYRQHWDAGILAHVFMNMGNMAAAQKLSQDIRRVFPMASIIGCCTDGNILKGMVSDYGTLLLFSVFESTRVETMNLPFLPGEEEKAALALSRAFGPYDDLRAIEFLVTVMKIDPSGFFSSLRISPPSLPIFGAGIIGLNPASWTKSEERAFLMTEKGIVQSGAVAVAYRGKDLHVCLKHVLGWKPVGMVMEATKSSGRILETVDDEPAYEIYRKYLDIPKDRNFFRNSLGFPFLVQETNHEFLRVPSAVTAEGHLFFPGEIPQSSKLRLTYGNPGEILRDVRQCCNQLRQFSSQGTLVYECIDRRAFWNTAIHQELAPFGHLGDVAGCFLEGEFLGTAQSVIRHECTILIIGMREGEAAMSYAPDAPPAEERLDDETAMLKRMATFVQRTTDALQTAYHQMTLLNEELQVANRRLSHISKTDELTQLLNRREIERRIHSALKEAYEKSEDVSLVLIDIDFFKKVNDTFGHAIGDSVLRQTAKILANAVHEENGEAAGRWGGEEFILLLPGCNLEKSVERAEQVRKEIAAHRFAHAGHQTVSIGVASSKDKIAKEVIFIRADEALYQAKSNGRNQVIAKEA
ncbi:MAG: diguanylate cyclase [Selenomonadaceae bacterium]|nr:diguanylate cyclase [Selenomonadaceae bacterium]